MIVTYRPPHRFCITADQGEDFNEIRAEMLQWLDDNNIEFLEIQRGNDSWDFCICSYTEEQKEHLAWFKFKWMKFDGTDA